MSTITAIFEPRADGTLHLPVPAAWRSLPIRVKITMAADFDEPLEDFKDLFQTNGNHRRGLSCSGRER